MIFRTAQTDSPLDHELMMRLDDILRGASPLDILSAMLALIQHEASECGLSGDTEAESLLLGNARILEICIQALEEYELNNF